MGLVGESGGGEVSWGRRRSLCRTLGDVGFWDWDLGLAAPVSLGRQACRVSLSVVTSGYCITSIWLFWQSIQTTRLLSLRGFLRLSESATEHV